MRSELLLSVAILTSVLASPALAQTPSAPPAARSDNGAVRLLPSAAAVYADYQGEVSTITAAPLSSASDLDDALDTFGAANATQLSSGWISYSAMIAAQNKEFAASVRDIDGYFGRERVMAGMRNDVGYARTLDGGESALQSALNANSKDSGRISSAAAFVKQQAYKLQDVAWGKTRLKDPSGEASRLKVSAKAVRPITDAAMKLLSGPDLNLVLTPAAASGGQSGSVWDSLSIITASAPAAALSTIVPASAPAPSLKVDPRREGTANRIVTLAALHVLEAEKSNADDVKAAMKDHPTYDCIDWSQLQLQACVSAAYTRADLSFCLAEHAIGDAGTCFSSVAR